MEFGIYGCWKQSGKQKNTRRFSSIPRARALDSASRVQNLREEEGARRRKFRAIAMRIHGGHNTSQFAQSGKCRGTRVFRAAAGASIRDTSARIRRGRGRA